MPLDFSQYAEQEDAPDFSASATPLDFSSNATSEEPKEQYKGNLKKSAQAAASDMATAMDMILGFPAFVAKFNATNAAAVWNTLAGKEDPLATARAWSDTLVSKGAGKIAAAPVESLFELLGIVDQDTPGVAQEMFGKVSTGIEHIAEKAGDDPDKQAAVKQLIDGGMILLAGLGARGAREKAVKGVDDLYADARYATEPSAAPAERAKIFAPDELAAQAKTASELAREKFYTTREEPAPKFAEFADQPSDLALRGKLNTAIEPQPIEELSLVPKEGEVPLPTREEAMPPAGYEGGVGIEEPTVFTEGASSIEQAARKFEPTGVEADMSNFKSGEPVARKLGGTGKSGFGQGGAIGWKREPTLEEKATTLSKDEWIKQARKLRPAETDATHSRVYDKLRERDAKVSTTVNTLKDQFATKVKDWDGQNKVDERTIMQGEDLLLSLEKNKAAREGLYDLIESGTAKDHPFVRSYKNLTDSIFKRAKDEGVVKSYIENYITHMYDFGKQSKSATLKSIYDMADSLERTFGSGMSSKSQYARERVFQTIQEAADKAGLVPLTKDPVEVYNLYASSMLKAVNNKKLINELSHIKDGETGQSMIIDVPKDGNYPKNYVTIDNRQFTGKLVHKSIAPAMDSMFASYKPSDIARVVQGVSALAKTAIFSFSAFHIKSLVDVLLGTARTKNIITDQKAMMDMWRKGGAGDVVDDLLRGGLEIGHSSIDLNPGLVKSIVEDTAKLGDRMVPGLGTVVRLPGKAAEGLTNFLWKTVHPSFKLALANQEYARLLSNGMDKKLAAETAATFANDAFGGLNWRRLALNADTEAGANLANALASKRGQAYAQVALLAPDWTIATARTWLGAIRKGQSPEERAMYAKYLLQSAVIYSAFADLLNLHFTGHHFWENEDPTYVDLGDGRKMQLSKHFMEGIHWMTDPDKTIANKLGTVPSEFISQITNKQYISPRGAPDIIAPESELEKLLGTNKGINKKAKNLLKRVEHMAGRFAPITAHSMANQPIESSISGFLGVPIYGQTPEQSLQQKLDKLSQ